MDCLHLLAHHILIHTNEELGQFYSFSRWLRHEIDMQSAEPMSQTLEELMEKTDLVEYPQTLKYIRGALAKSKLRHYIQQLPMMGIPRPPPPPPSAASMDKWAPTGQGHDRSFYDAFKKLLRQQSQELDDDDANHVELPKMNDLTKRLGLQFEKVFGQIALTQRRGILHRSPLALHPDCDRNVIDMTMRYEDAEKDSPCVVYLATRSTLNNHLRTHLSYLLTFYKEFLTMYIHSIHIPRSPRLRERRQLDPNDLPGGLDPPRRRDPTDPVRRRRRPHGSLD